MLLFSSIFFTFIAGLHLFLSFNGIDFLRDLVGGICLFIVFFVLVIVCLSFSSFSLGFRKLGKQTRRSILNERYSKSKVENEKFDCVIIGSGMGGLSCGASLSRFGKKVLVLEQHEVAGGGTHTFVLDGKTNYCFDSGLHYTVPQSAELIQLACGTRNKPLEFDKLDEGDGCFDRIVLGDVTEEGFQIKHQQAHLDALRKMFPNEKDQKELDEFLNVADKINGMIPLWLISKVFPKWFRKIWKRIFLSNFTKYSSRTGEDVTREIISNPKLAAILCGLWLDAGSPPDRATFMMTAALSVGFPKEGGAYPTGGSELMATRLIQGIELSGGKVLMRAKVDEILVDENSNSVKGVKVFDGTTIECKTVISACGYANTYLKLLKENHVPREYFSENKETGERILPPTLRNSGSWIMANIGIKGSQEEFDLLCSNTWVQPSCEENNWDLFQGIRDYFNDPLNAKVIPMMITFPSIKDRANKKNAQHISCQLLAVSNGEWFKKFEHENGKHPTGGEYEEIKGKWLKKLVNYLTTRYPKMKDRIEIANLSTELSIKYYLNKPGGGAVGLDVNPERFVDSKTEDLLDMKSPISGLWLTGEDTLLCGQPLAQLSGILTCWRIMGIRGSISFVLGIFRLAISDLLGL